MMCLHNPPTANIASSLIAIPPIFSIGITGIHVKFKLRAVYITVMRFACEKGMIGGISIWERDAMEVTQTTSLDSKFPLPRIRICENLMRERERVHKR